MTLCQFPACSERDVTTDLQKSLLSPFLSFLPLSHSATEEFLSMLLVSVMIQPLPPKGQLFCLPGQGNRLGSQGVGVTSELLRTCTRHQVFPAAMIPSCIDSKTAVIWAYKQLGERASIEKAEAFDSSM